MARRKKSQVQLDREKRMKWWHDARFGMFVHWGLYSLLERHEWVMNRERIPRKEYEKLAARFNPKPRPMREWARLARDAGMKYMVMTTKHHDGFCLWDTQMTDYNAVKCGPGRDLVREYVEACREFGLKIGFYYSLMDWHHPDGARCAKNEPARRRFVDFTYGCVQELMSNYGKIDILWYDVSWPLSSPEAWESRKMNRMARKLQPHLVINDRSQIPEDFGTPEEHITAEDEGRAWEACMTFNGSWGYQPTPDGDWRGVREVVQMLRQVTAGGGNLLLNIGPQADGSVPREAVDRLNKVGRWIDRNKPPVYGEVTRCDKSFEWVPTGSWTMKGDKTAYFWCGRWPGSELALGGLKGKVKRVTMLPDSRKTYRFEQTSNRLVIQGLPKTNPDKIAAITILRLDFASKPRQQLGTGCVVL